MLKISASFLPWDGRPWALAGIIDIHTHVRLYTYEYLTEDGRGEWGGLQYNTISFNGTKNTPADTDATEEEEEESEDEEE